jgi:hypothetical protein
VVAGSVVLQTAVRQATVVESKVMLAVGLSLARKVSFLGPELGPGIVLFELPAKKLPEQDQTEQ